MFAHIHLITCKSVLRHTDKIDHSRAQPIPSTHKAHTPRIGSGDGEAVATAPTDLKVSLPPPRKI